MISKQQKTMPIPMKKYLAAMILYCVLAPAMGWGYFPEDHGNTDKATDLRRAGQALRISLAAREGSAAPPFDEISLTMPVYNALRGQVVKKESLENTLYANIRLRKIIQEYLGIRRRALSLLDDFTPGHDPLEGFLASTYHSQEFQDITQALSLFSNEFQWLPQQAVNAGHAQLHEKTTAASAGQHTAAATLSSATKTQTSPPSGPGIDPMANNFVRDLISAQAGSRAPADRRVSRRRSPGRPPAYTEEVSLPWIIRAPLEVFRYITTHVVEALIYGALLLIGLSILSALKTKN